MVKLVIKKGDEELFLFETTVDTPIDDLFKEVVPIYNGRLKVHRICGEMEQLADHGITLPPNMMGLTEDQIEDLKLKDEWADKCEPSGGSVFKKDDIGRRNGQAPNDQMAEVMKKTIKEAKDMIHKNMIKASQVLTLARVQEAVDILRGATMIVYPMGLPPHDPIRMELENEEDLTGTHAAQEVIEVDEAAMWWAGKEFIRGKKLMDFVGKNEKTKIVVKISKKGTGAPAREKVISEEDQKQMMAYYYKKQEDFKKLEAANDDAYLDSAWADSGSLKKQFQGLSNIKWGPGK